MGGLYITEVDRNKDMFAASDNFNTHFDGQDLLRIETFVPEMTLIGLNDRCTFNYKIASVS